MRKVLENGDRLAVISGGDKIVLTTIGDEVSVKEMASLAEAEREAILFVGLTPPPYLEPEEVQMIEESIARDENRVYHVVSIDGEYIGWSSEAGLSSLKDFAGEPVIVLSGDEDGNHYTVNEWVIFYNPDNHKFVCEREGETHSSDNFWDIVGKCKNSK